jgi:hypothetical protein
MWPRRESSGVTSTSASARIAVYAAYAAALFFALHLATYFVPSIRDATISSSLVVAVALAVLAVAQHLVVFPVVYALNAPVWAKVAAYIWLVVDTATDLMQVADTPKSIYLPVRLVVNVLAALWIAAASLRMGGVARLIGLIVAVSTALYSALALFSQLAFVVTLPALVLLPLWFLLAGRRLSREQAA